MFKVNKFQACYWHSQSKKFISQYQFHSISNGVRFKIVYLSKMVSVKTPQRGKALIFSRFSVEMSQISNYQYTFLFFSKQTITPDKIFWATF